MRSEWDWMFDYVRQLRRRNEVQKIELGCRARDRVTGFTGIVTGFAKHLTGCDTYGLDPGLDKDGKLGSDRVFWFDVQRLDVIETCAQTGITRMAPQPQTPSGITAG